MHKIIETPHRMIRVACGFLIAPMTPSFLYFGSLALSGSAPNLHRVCIVAFFSYLIAAVAGFPSYLMLERRKAFRLLPYLIAGFLIGVVLYISVMVIMLLNVEFPLEVFVNTLAISVITIASCMISAATFWVIVKKN